MHATSDGSIEGVMNDLFLFQQHEPLTKDVICACQVALSSESAPALQLESREKLCHPQLLLRSAGGPLTCILEITHVIW